MLAVMDTKQNSRAGQAEQIPELLTATPKQLAYIEGMAAHGVGARAAREAGYSKKSADSLHQRMSKIGWVSEAIIQRREQLNGETGTDPATIRAELWSVYLEARKKGNYSAVCRSLELLGKANGMFGPDRLEVTGKDGQPLNKEPISDLDMARRISFALRNAAENTPEAEPEPDPAPLSH